MINGNLGNANVSVERAQCPGHEPRIVSAPLDISGEVVACGTIMSRADDGMWVRMTSETGYSIGTGDGTNTNFNGTLSENIYPGSVRVTDGNVVLVDNGSGLLTYAGETVGTVNYRTGDIVMVFDTAPADGADVTVDYFTSPDGVLDEPTDTAQTTVGNIVIHGTVRQGALVVGAAAAAPSEDILIAMQDKGIFPA